MAKKAKPSKKRIKYVPQLGDVVAIKIRPGKFVHAKVAFVSVDYKGLALFRVYDSVRPSAAEFECLSTYRCQFRAYADKIESSHWKVVGHYPSKVGDKKASRYITAEGLYEGDARIRDVRDSDFDTLMPMSICMNSAAEHELRKKFGV